MTSHCIRLESALLSSAKGKLKVTVKCLCEEQPGVFHFELTQKKGEKKKKKTRQRCE